MTGKFQKLANWMNGRHTLFAAFFAISGTSLAWCHHLSQTYVNLIWAIQGFVFAHSCKEDIYNQQSSDSR